MTDSIPARSDLHAETLALLDRRPYKLSVQQIADDTGVSAHWIRALVADRMADPSAIRLELVRDYLVEREARLNSNV